MHHDLGAGSTGDEHAHGVVLLGRRSDQETRHEIRRTLSREAESAADGDMAI